ncbi:MAG TPA: helix-turn-helix domain-containing protein [Nocardioidaceae bacterium]|nr:helix-turn-helix domain-containing protein [Nocardioidaceae bacterium]
MAHGVFGAEDGVSVQTLLAEPLLHGTVVGGESGLGNTVVWCLPLSEVDAAAAPAAGRLPDDLAGIAVHVGAGRLAVGEGAHALVTDLAKRGAAAVIAWPARGREATREGGRTVGLETAARAADAASLPVVAVSCEADFRRTSQLVATKVLAQTTHVLEYGARVHRILGEVFAHGSGLSAMARTMSQLSRTPVMVLGLTGEILAQADVTRPRGGLPDQQGLGRVVTEALAAHQHERAEGAASGYGSGTHSHARTMDVELAEGPMRAVVAPVTVAGDAYGAVLLLERVWPPERHDLAQHTVIAEHGATLAGSELLRQHSVHEAEERARDDFVDTLLHGRFTDQHELAARARHYRFDPQARFAVFVATSAGLRSGRTPDNHRANDALRSLRMARSDDLLTLTALIGPMIVVVRQLPTPSSEQGTTLAERESRTSFGKHIRRTLRDRLGDDVRVAHGRGGKGASGVAESYREARSAATLTQQVGGSKVCGYDDLRVFAAIQEVASSAPGRSFAAEVLEPLRRADGQTGNLEEIVLAYIAESGNLNAAARRLHLHRNTMLYKLERASRALQMDVRISETQFMVWLAHHIDTLGSVEAALDNELSPPT